MIRSPDLRAGALFAFALFVGLAPCSAQPRPTQAADDVLVYIGTFTAKESKGIYLTHMDRATGRLTEPQLVAEATSPSFLALHPSHRFLYAVNEADAVEGKPGGAVSAFAIDPADGKLSGLGRQPSGGGGPTHIDIDRQGRNVLVANYGTGSVAVLPVDADGHLAAPSSVDQHTGKGPDRQRQEAPHAHCINVDPGNRFALSCDLGLDKVFVYRFDPKAGSLAPGQEPFAKTAPGSGPRHLAFHPSGRFVYVVTEMGCTVEAFNFDPAAGTLKPFQAIPTLPANFRGEKSGAEIRVHPSGRFLYTSNRGEANSIAAFAIDPPTGRLTSIGFTPTQGRAPRSFSIDPTGKWLVVGNQDTDNVVVFRIDGRTGELKPAGIDLHVPTPVCITFVPHEGTR